MRPRTIALPKIALTVAAVIVLAMVSLATVVFSNGGFGGNGDGGGFGHGIGLGGSEVRQASAQLETAPYNICTRHPAIIASIAGSLRIARPGTYDEIRLGVQDDPGTSADESVDAQSCTDDPDYGMVPQAHLDNISGITASGAGIFELEPNDFAGLRRVRTLNLSNNNLRDLDRGLFEALDSVTTVDLSHNQLRPGGMYNFPVREDGTGAGMRLGGLNPGVFGLLTRATSYDFGHNPDLGPPNPLWFGPVTGPGIDLESEPAGHVSNIQFLGLANTGLDGDTFPVDLFDRFGDAGANVPPELRAVDMSENPNLHLINTRWFERLVKLSGFSGRPALQFWGSEIGRMFYNADSNYPPADHLFGSEQPFQDRQRGLYTSDADSPNSDASPQRLATIIRGAISDWAVANGRTDSSNIDTTQTFEFRTTDSGGATTTVTVNRFAPIAVELYNICSRAEKVRDAVMPKLIAGVDYYVGINLTNAGDACPRPFRSVLVQDLNTLEWPDAANLLDLSHEASDDSEQLQALLESDLRGLTGIRALSLAGNDLGMLPSDIFFGIELEYLDLSDNARLGPPQVNWFDATLLEELEVLLLNGLDIRGLDLPPNTFDQFTGLKLLEMKDLPDLGVINYRWFTALTGLTGLDGGSGLRFDGSTVYRYFDSEHADWPSCDDSTACNVPQPPIGTLSFQYTGTSAPLLAGALQTAIGGTANIVNTDTEFAPEQPTVRGICDRPPILRDAIAAKLATDVVVWSGTTLPTGSTCDAAIWGVVPVQELGMLVWDGSVESIEDPPGSGTMVDVRNILDLSGTVPGMGEADTRLTSLHQSHFDGLTGLEALDLSVNDLSTLPPGVFSDPPLKILILRNNPQLGVPPAEPWLSHGDPGVLEFLDLGDTGLDGSTLAHDAFAHFDGLKQLWLTDNPDLGVINAKWFEAMPRLEQLGFAGSLVTEYYYGTGTPADAAASADTMDDPSPWVGYSAALAAYIESYIDAFPNPAHERDVMDDPLTDADETESRDIDGTQNSFAPETDTLYDLCDRTDAVRDEILEELKADGGLYDDQQVSQCAQANGEVLTTATHLATLTWPDRAGRFDISGQGVTELQQSDFAGLPGLNALDISDNAIDPSGMTEGVFAEVPILEIWGSNTQLAYPQAWWFDATQVANLHRMIWHNTGIVGTTMPLDTFDAFVGLRKLELRDQTSLRFINTRWFERLTNLDHYDDSGSSGIRFRGSNVASFFYDATVQTPDRDMGERLNYGPTADAVAFDDNAAALATAIETAITTWAAAQTPAITPDLQINATDRNFAPLAFISYDVCSRTVEVRDAIIDALKTDPATSGAFGSILHSPGGASCASGFRTVSSTEMAALQWPTADGVTRRTLDLRGQGITDLDPGDFAGLTGLRSVDLANNALVNANLEAGVFGAGTVADATAPPLQSVLLANNPALVGVEAAWFDAEQRSTISQLDLTNTGVPNDLAHDTFDSFSRLYTLLLMNNPGLGQINTRWFERLASLRLVWFGGNLVSDYYYDADGTNSAGASPYLGASQLGAAINMRINTWAAAQPIERPHQTDSTDARFAPLLSVDICSRPKIIWAEVMFNMGMVPLTTTGVPSREDSYGDVRDVRYRDLVCPGPLPAILVDRERAQPLAPGTAVDAALHDRAVWSDDIRTFARLGRFRLDLSNAAGLAPNGTLNPADFENLYMVDELLLGSNLIDTIPLDTFAQMPALQRLSLSDNRLANDDLSGGANFLGALVSPLRLDLDGNLLTAFDSSWLPQNARTDGSGLGSLDELNIGNQPVKQANFENLDLSQLRFDGTHLSTIDPAIATMTNLEELRWNALAEQDLDLHERGASAFFASLPASLKRSLPGEDFGNRFGIQDEVVGREAVELQLAHFRRLREIQGARQQIEAITLYDPCRRSVSASGGVDAWAAAGSLCLTAADRDEVVNALGQFDALSWIDVRNGGLSDAQMNRLLESLRSNQLVRLQLDSNPDAFGAGFQDSWLNVFRNSDWERLRYLSIQNNDITFAQASTILGNLAAADGAYGDPPEQPANLSAQVRFGLERLNLSHNPGLFTGVAPATLDGSGASVARGFLEGIPQRQAVFAQPFELLLAETGLKFDQLVAIIDSIDEPGPIADFAQQVRLLDVSDNPDLWEKVDGTRASATEITGLFDRLKGLTGLDISNTGLLPAELPALINGIDDVLARTLVGGPPDQPVGLDPVQERMELLAIAGLDLSAVSGLGGQFDGFSRRSTSLNEDTLSVLDLSDTGLDLATLNALGTALNPSPGDVVGVLNTITVLDLSGNPMLLDTCVSSRGSVVGALARFTNVRHIYLDDGTVGSFEELDCVVAGLEQMDGLAGGNAPWIATFSIDDNPNAFIKSNPGPATPAEVLALSQRIPVALKSFGGSTLVTIPQARSFLQPDVDALPVDDRESAERLRDREIFSKYNMRTPAPQRVRVASGQNGVRVVIDQVDSYMAAGTTLDITGYEYRIRERGDNPDRAWVQPDAEWKTISVSTNDDGAKEFFIDGLEPSTSYQVEVRSLSELPTSGAVGGSGGTLVGLPIVLRVAPAITSVSIRAGDSVRLAVDVYDRADRVDNALSEKNDNILVFQWSSDGGGSFGTPNDDYRVVYTAPSSPGTYTVRAEAGPDGICLDHHADEFGISDEERASCIAQFTVLVTRAAAVVTTTDAAPVNPAGVIPSSLVDTDGVQYSVFTPEDGGRFDGDGIVVTADAGAVPDRQLLGVAATRSDVEAPEAQPGARVTFGGSFYDIMGVQRNGDRPVAGFRLDEALTVCVPMPDEFGGNLNDVALVSRDAAGVVGVLSSNLRQVNGGLSVCGKVSLLPATVAAAKVGLVAEAVTEVESPTEVQTPDTGGTAPNQRLATMALAAGVVLLLAVAVIAVAAVISRTVRKRSASSS